LSAWPSTPLTVKIRSLVLAVLLIAPLGYCAKQQFVEKEARADAEAVAAALQQHKSSKSAYPANLAEIGFDPRALRDRWHLSYRLEEGKPYLFYSAQDNWLVAYHYNFDSRIWESRD
jgi:hypothetical protein